MPRTDRLVALRVPLRVVVVLTAATALWTCEVLYPDPSPVSEAGLGCVDADSDPSQTVSWRNDLEAAIIQRPRSAGTGCSCHLPTFATPTGIQMSGLDLESYGSMSQGGFHSRSNIVVAGHPCASVLYLKLVAPPFGARMPRMGGYLSPRETALFHDWIAEGAHDY
jgi:hypothetical protein